MTEPDDSTDARSPHGVEIDARDDAVTSESPESLDDAPPARSPLWPSLLIALAVVVLDQLTKRWALDALADGRPRHVVWTLQWNLTFNSGMAFSRGQGIGPYIGAVALVVVVVLLLSLRRSSGMLSTIAVGLVVGGAVGNLIDRLFREDGWLRGRVVDFVDLQWFPIFNVADMGVTIGGALLLLAAVSDSRSTRQ